MDERQGVIERHAFKPAYLYSEFAALRKAVPAGGESRPQVRASRPPLLAWALARRHKPLGISAICPGWPFEIGTAEFWKRAAAGAAFERMYAATGNELRANSAAGTDPTSWVRMAIVAPDGSIRYEDDF